MMKEGLNKVLLMGNVGQEPELKTTTSGTAILSLHLATNYRSKNQRGTWDDRTEWHNVVLFGPRAEALSTIITKGSGLFVEGRNQTRNWEAKDGTTRYSTEVVAYDIKLIGGRPVQNECQRQEEDFEPMDDDIPL